MAESPDYRDLLQSFIDCKVEYLIVGGYAVMKYSEPRYTKDLDIWVNCTEDNSARAYRALAQFGAPLQHDAVTPETFSEPNVVYQIGVAPVRADVLTTLSGVSFEKAWQRRETGSFHGARRGSDLRDIERIRKKSK